MHRTVYVPPQPICHPHGTGMALIVQIIQLNQVMKGGGHISKTLRCRLTCRRRRVDGRLQQRPQPRGQKPRRRVIEVDAVNG